MFDKLRESFTDALRKLTGRGRLSEKNIEEGVREVRMALLQADVNFKVVKDFVDRVTAKAVGQDVLKSVQPWQQFIKVLYDEMVDLMGPVDHSFPQPQHPPLVVMMVGLQGSGKTTTCAKLANYLRKKGRKPMLVAADMVRPAAVEQLKTLGRQHDLPVYFEESGRPVKICARGIVKAKEDGLDTVVLDTQGRLHIDTALMEELVEVKKTAKPHTVLLVADAMTGQDAVNSASQFHQKLGIDGVILSKMDGDARGGAAMSIKAVTGQPIKFVGIGERIEELEEFHPDRVASRILGMGDMVSLVEKAQGAVDQEEAKKLQEKFQKDELTLQDFYKQLQAMKKMGPMKQILSMIPGFDQMAPEIDEDELKYSEAIIQSMTMQERENPEIINPSRRKRIARGCGRPVYEVSRLLEQFDQARSMLKDFKKGKADFGDFLDPKGKKRPRR